jgi:phenylacetate-CoA ligase
MYNYLRIFYYLNRLRRHAYWSHKKLSDYQNRKVRAIIKYAYDHSGFYHQKFRQLGIKPDDIRCLKDLNKLPIIKKADLRNNFKRIISDDFDLNSLRILKTSGSSGHPLSVCLSKKEHEFRMAKMLRANISCGQKSRDKWFVITAPAHLNKRGSIHNFLGFYSPFSVSVFEKQATQISLIQSFRPNVIEGYSSSLVLLANEMKQRGLKPAECRLVIGNAELIDDSSRSFVESVFDVPFYDQYASNELESMAWQCVEKDGYHIDADTLIMQVVDKNGEEVAPGERGELVFTSLFNFAMPFIRYAIGDVGVLSTDKCACGRSFPLMRVIEGRKDSFIRFRDGKLFSPRNFTIAMSMFSLYSQIDLFRVVQKDADVIEFLVKLKDEHYNKEHFSSLLEAHIREKLELDASEVHINTRFIDSLPLDKGGKLATVVSEINS